MDTLEKLKGKLDQLLRRYEKLEAVNKDLRTENNELRARIADLEKKAKLLSDSKGKAEKQLGEANEAAVKRISRLVEKIDQLQSELEFS